jgi:hypothetical protein
VLPATARSIPATAAGVGAITFAAGHFVKLVNRELVDFNVQIGHVTLLFWEGTIPSWSVVAGSTWRGSLVVWSAAQFKTGHSQRPPTEAALFLDYAALLTHQRLISIDLAGKSRPALGKIFQNLGFILMRRQFHQPMAFRRLILAVLCAVHGPRITPIQSTQT